MRWIFLDFGTYKIKALCAQIDGNQLQVEGYHTWNSRPEYFQGLGFPTEAGWNAVSIGLQELGWTDTESNQEQGTSTPVLTPIPGSYMESRYLQFPFSSERKIEKVLPFELEPLIPFDLEDLFVRHRILKGTGIKDLKSQTLVYVMSVKHDHIRNFEAELRKFQLSPPSFGVDFFNYFCLRSFLPVEPVHAVLSLGHSKSQWCYFQRSGSVLNARNFWWGGKEFAHVFTEALKITEAQALSLLQEKASLDVSAESHSQDIHLAELCEKAIEPFLQQLRQYFKSLDSNGLKLIPNLPIYLTGGLAQLRGLSARFNERIGKEFNLQFLDFPITQLDQKLPGIPSIQSPHEAMSVIATALSQTKNQRGKLPIFSQSSFQWQHNLRKLRSSGAELARRLGILILLPAIYFLFAIILNFGETEKIREEVESVLPPGQYTEASSLEEIHDQLRKDLIEYRKKADALDEDRNSPLLILSQLSSAIPSNLKVDLKEFQVTEARVLLTAMTDDALKLDRIYQAILQIFPEAQKGSQESCERYDNCRQMKIEWKREKAS